MKIYLKTAIFVNRAPFDNLRLDFEDNQVSVLSAVNGKGKTTLLSHITDAFYELAKKNFTNEFEGKANKFYRVSSVIYNTDQSKSSFVYLRFNTPKGDIDYLDVRNDCTEEEYNQSILIEDKIPYGHFQHGLNKTNCAKVFSPDLDSEKIGEIFSSNLLTYFPSYRFEHPGYLNDPFKIKMDFKKLSDFTGYLKNPIEVISGLPQLANWIMDVVLDNQYLNVNIDDITRTTNSLNFPPVIPPQILPRVLNIIVQTCIKQKSELQDNLNSVLSHTLVSRNFGNVRFGIGPRNFGSTRIQIVKSENGEPVYPSIFNISSGESAMLCIFGELLRQADNIKTDCLLSDITGIVLIDEIDKHLHIKLQKETLPKLLKLFPNVQFIVSSHSPFLGMGLAEDIKDRSKIIDLDNLGISKDPTNNELYTEVYNLMVSENERFKDLYTALESKVRSGNIPLIVTEGKTDFKLIRKAKEKLKISDCDVEFYEVTEEWGESKLKTLLENLAKIQQPRKVIGIFDRDVSSTISDIERNGQVFKDYGNNVYAFCIPIPATRDKYQNISIEFYFSDSEIKKIKNGRSFTYFGSIKNYCLVDLRRFELLTPSLQMRCSDQLSHRPKMLIRIIPP